MENRTREARVAVRERCCVTGADEGIAEGEGNIRENERKRRKKA